MNGPKQSRRTVSIHDASAWVFNRMADVYDSRPPYPAALIDALCDLAGAAGRRIGDLGAGIGHLALPLAARGFELTAIEPAQQMLARLSARASQRGLPIRALHAAAEALPLEAGSLDLVLIADALHFIDTELAAHEIARVLVARGTLALVTCEPGPTPFMRELSRLMEDSAPRRPRALASRSAQLSGVAHIPLEHELRFQDETKVTPAELERILGSISFIGPAMNARRTAAFRERLHALPSPAVWARTFSLRWGRRRRSARVSLPQSRPSSV
jgi:ubiquinone/menaquinone biosynthesis C-methylase UbiE